MNTMKWDTIKTNAQYIEVLKRVILIMDAKPGTPESKESEELLALLTKYEKKHVILPELDM
ncbi:MAG TPA: transcriptional regulator, partial [Candidatus Paceibacterota bacterium]|nr:transcriptional regulator [Candidatus Paceibacterota bacterium]